MSVLNPYLYAYNPDLLACENAWVKFIRDNEFLNNDVISKEIRESWDYCKNNNIEALSREPIPLLSKEELADRIRNNKEILEIVSPFLITLFEIVEHSGFRVDFVDAEGCILKSFSDKSINELIQKTQSCEGAIRCEEKAGTNAIALALKTKKPIQISGGEHYMQQFHRWSCSAAPIMDEKGKVFGVVNMAGRYEGVHKHTLALVAYVAKAIENAIQVQKINEELKMSNEQLNTILGGVSDGIVYTKEDMIEGVNKEMCSFLGEKEENITGKYIEEAIHTTPNVKELIKSVKNNFQNREIILEGKNHALNCLVDIRNTYNQDGQKSGEIIIFTRVEEIQMMAKKIVNTPKYSFNDIIGTSAALKATIETAQRAAMYNSRVIIHGESGTGKEMLAQAIHNYSRRKYGSFIAVDCGAIPKELFEAELFGYEEGSFTGAKAGGKTGLIELADKGTLFLDEIGNMPLDSQKKLLRALQEGTINKVGSNENIEVDIRVIAATNMDLLKAIEEGEFREDLYYRLNVFYIEVSPLRERREDIGALVKYYIKNNTEKRKPLAIDNEAMEMLMAYDWPGNAREVNNVIERAIIMSSGDVLTKKDFPLEVQEKKNIFYNNQNEDLTLNEAMQVFVTHALANNNGNITKTAEQLNVSRTTVYKILNESNQKRGIV